MTLPQRILREMTEKVATVEAPPFGSIYVLVKMNYQEAQLHRSEITVSSTETFRH